MNDILIIVITFLISAAIMLPVGMLLRKKIAESKIQGAEKEANRLLENAKIEAENKKKEEIFRVKEEMLKARNELDQEIKERRGEVQLQEKRIRTKSIRKPKWKTKIRRITEKAKRGITKNFRIKYWRGKKTIIITIRKNLNRRESCIN